MLEDTAIEGILNKTWQLGFPPTASLHNCLSWRPGSTWLALQCDAAMLVVLDIGEPDDEMPAEVQRLAWNKGGGLMAVAWTDDGRFLVTAHAGELGALSVFQVESDRLTQMLHCPMFFWPKDLCVSMCRDDTSQLIIAVGGSPGVVLYKTSIDEGNGRWKLQQVGRLCHLWPVCAVEYGQGGRYLAAAGLGGQLCIWDMTAADARLELQVQVPAERVTRMAFSACGHALAVACWGGAVFLYLQQDGALDPALFGNPTAASEPGGGSNKEAAQADNSTACPEQGGGHVLAAAVPGNEVMGEGDEAAYQSQTVSIAHGADVEAAVQDTRSVSLSAAQGGGRADLAAAAHGGDMSAQGAPAPCELRLAAIDIGEQDIASVSPSVAQGGGQAGGPAAAAHEEDTSAQGAPARCESRLAAIVHGKQDIASVSPSAAAQGGGQAGGLAAAAPGEDTVAQGAPVAYESRLAAIDHGTEGAGGWRVGAACLPGQPIKAGVTGPMLLEWVGDDALLVTLPSGALTILQTDGASSVQKNAFMGSSKISSAWPQATGSALESQYDASSRDTKSHGQPMVVCYDRARLLRMAPVADL
ncbi:g11549 [Coccomyxa elongata]